MTTTVRELIEELENYDPEAPVLIAHQPSWPLAEVVAHVTTDDDPETDDPNDAAVWIVAGGHPSDRSPYAPGFVFEM